MSILVINAGSTSLKFGLFDADAREALLSGSIDWPGGDRHRAKLAVRRRNEQESRSVVDVPDDRTATLCAIQALGADHGVNAVGHRVVHGGTEFQGAARIDERVKATIDRLGELAPLHNPPALAAIKTAETAMPGLPQVAVFDTAFFARLPARAYVFPLPHEWYEQWGIRRFGFHGISNTYCAARAAELLGRSPSELRIVTCHLGGGCSATAVRNGLPVATTMGFTPLAGLMMGTRSGSVDPGILIHLQRRHGLTVDELDHALNYRSGLLGASGVSADMAKIEAAANQGDQRAQLAFDIFADNVRSIIGAMTVTLGGIDALVFTDRIGEGSRTLRAAACDGLDCIGVRLDPQRNADCRPDTDVAAPASTARILVIHTREELMIAREVRRTLSSSPTETH
jgi:acetate kinase